MLTFRFVKLYEIIKGLRLVKDTPDCSPPLYVLRKGVEPPRQAIWAKRAGKKMREMDSCEIKLKVQEVWVSVIVSAAGVSSACSTSQISLSKRLEMLEA